MPKSAMSNIYRPRQIRSIGLLKEIKHGEFRVLFTPDHIRKLVKATRAQVFVSEGAGDSIGVSDLAYAAAGATICPRNEVLKKDLIVGVKETQPGDFEFLGNGSIHMSYEHFAQSQARTLAALEASLKKGVTFIALETMQDMHGGFPTLAPMSEAAAEIVCQHAPMAFLRPIGSGYLPSGLPQSNIAGLNAVVLGGGIVGRTAAVRLISMGVSVKLLEANPERMRTLKEELEGRSRLIRVLESNERTLEDAFTGSHILISGVYRRGATPPKIVTAALLNLMAKGAITYFIDVDQGSSFAGELPETSILDPFGLPYIAGTDVRTFSPPNLPSMAAAHTSLALGNAVLVYVAKLAQAGLKEAALEDKTIATGINIFMSCICCEGLAKTFGVPYRPFLSLV